MIFLRGKSKGRSWNFEKKNILDLGVNQCKANKIRELVRELLVLESRSTSTAKIRAHISPLSGNAAHIWACLGTFGAVGGLLFVNLTRGARLVLQIFSAGGASLHALSF